MAVASLVLLDSEALDSQAQLSVCLSILSALEQEVQPEPNFRLVVALVVQVLETFPVSHEIWIGSWVEAISCASPHPEALALLEQLQLAT